MTDPNEIARLLRREYFPEFSSCCLTIKFKHVDGSISEVRPTYAFKDNQYKGVIKIYLDDSIRTSGLKALIGTIAHDIAHRVGWEGPGYRLISNREADEIVIEKGLGCYLYEAKKALEELKPEIVIDGYSSQQIRDILSRNS